ncbi:ATP-binding cassette sub-family A member 12 [Chanos chanos]|uniref:ATP-binding cassette sub-family A member 12 n=1 Tax=Chanos chanos TaxID=29144 RepID=A0A6J2WIF4_CHACN|nr:ATP-binding cassette sub-family A member 12 [Chanos chanos]
MASFFHQLRLLLWKNGLSIKRQPGWSLALIIWPLVIFIILAITRSQFPPKLKDTCYVAPRNLPSAGFFPFLQTLMCNTDSTCSNKSHLVDRNSRGHQSRHSRHPRDIHRYPDTDHRCLRAIWRPWEAMTAILNSVNTLKRSLCSFTMAVIDLSMASPTDPIAHGLIQFCMSNDTVLEVSLITFNQVLQHLLLSDPADVLESMGMAVTVVDHLQKQNAIWDFLLGLPDLFLKSTDEEKIMAGAERLVNLKRTLAAIQASFPQANIPTDVVNTVIDEFIGLLNYIRTWEGRDVNISLSSVIVPSSMSPEVNTMVQQVHIPLDKVFLAWSQNSASADVSFAQGFLGKILSLTTLLGQETTTNHSRTQRSSYGRPQNLAEETFLSVGTLVIDLLRGLPGWEYVHSFLMGGHSSMQLATQAMETQMELMALVLKDANNIQMTFLSLMNNQSMADTFTSHVMDSVVDNVMKVLSTPPPVECSQLAGSWSWMSSLSSLDPELWTSLVCLGNGTELENTLLAPLSPVIEKAKQLEWVINGLTRYNVSATMILAEWQKLSSTSLQYGNSLQQFLGVLDQHYLAKWIPDNVTVDWLQLLTSRGLGTVGTVGSLLEKSSLWPVMETYFQMANWIMSYQPNVTALPNCTADPNTLTPVCQMGFSWTELIHHTQTVIQEVSVDPAALRRPLQGALALLQNIYRDYYITAVTQSLSSSGQLLGDGSLQQILESLIHILDKNTQILSNLMSLEQFNVQLPLSILGDILDALGLRDLEALWTGGSQNNLISGTHPLLANVLQLLSPGSIQMLSQQGELAVLDVILEHLGAFLPTEYQHLYKNLANHTRGLIEDLTICSATGQDCLSEVQSVFLTMGYIDEVLAVGTAPNVPLLPIQGNMTLSVTGHILHLILPLNMSSLPGSSAMTVTQVLNFLQQVYATPNVSIVSIQQALQASNLGVHQFNQVVELVKASSLPTVLTDLMSVVNVQRCLSQQNQTMTSSMNSRETECALHLLKNTISFLQATPVPPAVKEALSTIHPMLMTLSGQFLDNRNASASGNNSLILTDEVLKVALYHIRENLQLLNLSSEALASLTNELNVLEGLLKIAIQEQYPYSTINSTLMKQQLYAQKVYAQITLWYLGKLENVTSASMFSEIFVPLLSMTEMQVALNLAQTDFSALLTSQIENLMTHVQPPLDGADMRMIGQAVVTILHGQLDLIKQSLEIEQQYYESVGFPMNISIPAEIETQIMTYLNLTREWLTDSRLTFAISEILRWDINAMNITTPMTDLALLIQALTPLLSVEQQNYLGVIEHVSQALNHALEIASHTSGTQNPNFAAAVLDTVKVVLQGIVNETGLLPDSVVHDVIAVVNGSLQLILYPEMSYADARHYTLDIVQRIQDLIRSLVPRVAAEILLPMTEFVSNYLEGISQTGGPDKWNEIIVDVMEQIQLSLPMNNSAQAYISIILDFTKFILSSDQGNVTFWESLINLDFENLDNLTEQLGGLSESLVLLLVGDENLSLTSQTAQIVTQTVPVLIQMLSGTANPQTFDRLEMILAHALSAFNETSLLDSSTVYILRDVIVSMAQNLQAQTDFIYSLQRPLSSLMSDIFLAMNTSTFNMAGVFAELPRAIELTIEATVQASLNGQMPDCSELVGTWEGVREAAGISEASIVMWCNVSLIPLIKNTLNSENQMTMNNMTGVWMHPPMLNVTAAEIVTQLESLYTASLNQSLAAQVFTYDLMQYISLLTSMPVTELESEADWNALFLNQQLHQSISSIQMALEQVEAQAPWLSPYVQALQKAVEYILKNNDNFQDTTMDPQVVIEAVDILLTGMNFTNASIHSLLSGDPFVNPEGYSIDQLIKDVIRKIIQMRLLGNWPVVYDVMEQFLYVDDTTLIFETVIDFVNWWSTSEHHGLEFIMEILSRVYDMVRAALLSVTQMAGQLPSYSNIYIDLVGNVLKMLRQIARTSDLFAPMDHFLIQLQDEMTHDSSLPELMLQTRNSRRVRREVEREPVDDFLDLLEIDYHTLFYALSIPPTPSEIMHTVHIFFSNPDLAILLKGMSRDLTGHSSEEETIDTALNVLSYLTLPSHGQKFIEVFTEIANEGWSLDSLGKLEKLAESLGKMVDVSMVLSQQPSLSIAQRVERMAEQLNGVLSQIISHGGNGSVTIHFLTAINDILSENLEELTNISPQVSAILQNIISAVSQPESQMSLEPYLMVLDQTVGAFASFLPAEHVRYFNISGQMIKAFTMIVTHPMDMEKVLMSSHIISSSLDHLLAISGITTLPNGQSIQEVTQPLIVSSVLSTYALWNLSASDHTFTSEIEKQMFVSQIINQMTSGLPEGLREYVNPVRQALVTALSGISSTADIRPAFFNISQQVTMSLLSSLNVTEMPVSMGISAGDIVHVLLTVSNQVSRSLFEGLMASSSPVQLPYVIHSLTNTIVSLSSVMPAEVRPYLNMSVQIMETVSNVLNYTSTTGNVEGATALIASAVHRLLTLVPGVAMETTGSIIGDLEQTIRRILLIINTVNNPLDQTAEITQQVLHTIENFLILANSSMELELAKVVLVAGKLNIGHLLMLNDTNWVEKLPGVLTNIANSLPSDLPLAPLIRDILRSLANESRENLHLLLQTIHTASELSSTAWLDANFSRTLDNLLTQVCQLEGMSSVQQISQALSLGPGVLCHTVVPTVQALHVLTSNLVKDSTDLYDALFQTFIGDPTMYNIQTDWSSVISNVLGFNITSLKTLDINMTFPSSVMKVSDLIKNKTAFVMDVMQFTSISPELLSTLLNSTLPSSNLQILAWLANLRHCPDPSVLQLDAAHKLIFRVFCSLPPQEWYSMVVLVIRHMDLENTIYRVMLASDIQGIVGVMLQTVRFLTDMMSRLVPAISQLQEYLVAFADLNLVADSEFHSLVRGKRSTMSSSATFTTLSRAMCKSGVLSLLGISKLPIMTEADPSLKEGHRLDDIIDKFKIPRSATPFCMNLYLDMVNTTGGAIAWAFLKPMLLGQVLYTPDTPLTRDIIEKSNNTLQQFGDLKLHAQEWLESSSYVMESAKLLNKTLPMLKRSLGNSFVKNFVKTQTNIDVEEISATLNNFSNLTALLEKNKFIVNQISTLSTLMMNLSSCVNFDRYKALSSVEEVDKQAESLAQNRSLYASVIFKLPEEQSSDRRRRDVSGSALPPKVEYTIRMHIDNVMRTDRIRNPLWQKGAYISFMLTQRYSRGFLYLQESIERAIIETQAGKPVDGPAVQVQAFPYPCFPDDEYLNSISVAFPLALIIAWILFVANFVRKLVHERELRLHEYMKMMGVNPISHFFAWFIESAVFLLVTIVFITLILKFGGILANSDSSLVFIYLCDYGLSVLAMSYLVSAFFDRTNIAGLSGCMIYIVCFFPFIVIVSMEESLSFSVKSALSLFAPTCFSYASQYISRYEKLEEGIQWSNMYTSPLSGDTSSFGWLCWLLLIDSLIYFLVGVYVRMVFPGKYGIPAPWYFPVTPSFWADLFGCCKKAPKSTSRGLFFSNIMQESQANGEGKGKGKGKGKGGFTSHGEEEFSGLPVGVSLHGLTKAYGNRNAVDHLTLAFYEGHVTSLLGHNGAGKTTTMSLLTGLFPPSSGSIEVYGRDMQAYTDEVRKELGVCMQYDVLFDHLTTEEHLLLYAQIKAPHWTKHEVKDQVRKILQETGMYAHRHKRVGTLSGGMKRKLSISIAFIGGSRLVVLDEPTTGVDPCSRRSIWDIVLQHKQDRTIILSTHHLDEAEVLSDRIAFLERGGVKCCGSPFYLKDKLAKGYNLTLTKKVQVPGSEEKFDIEELTAFIQSHLPNACLKEGRLGDVVYTLPPYNSQNASAYRSLLTSLDRNLDALHLGCYGISDTTLEEVFLQLTRDDLEHTEQRPWSVSESIMDLAASRDSLPDDLADSAYNLGEKASLTGASTVRGMALAAQQVMAMLVKRVHHSRRDWKGMFSQLVLPVLFVIAAMGLGSIRSDLQYFPEMELSPGLYHSGDQYAFFSNENPNSSYLVDTMMSYPGIDHMCLNNPSNPVCSGRGNHGPDQWTSRGNSSAPLEPCKCTQTEQICQKPSYDPPHKRNPSSQIVYNLTGLNVENYLLATANNFIRDRYGGWAFGKSLPLDLRMDIQEVPKNRTLTKVWYNPEGHHTMPAYLNSLNNFLLRSSLPADKDRSQYAITVNSHPYPGQVEQEDTLVRGLVSTLVAMCMLTGYSIMTASFVIYEVQEHHSGSKRLQHISGISEPFYWVINFLYDMAIYMIPVAFSVIMIAAFQLPAFTDRQNLAVVTLLLVLFGFATFPWMYLLSAVFKDAEMAFISYVCINLFVSVNTIISTSIVYFIGQLNQNDENVHEVYRVMSQVFLIFPQFSFGNGLMELSRVDLQVQMLSAYGVDAYKDPFTMDVLGPMFLSLLVQGTFFFTLRLLLNKWLIQRVRRLFCFKRAAEKTHSRYEDEDVVAERERVDGGAASSDLLQIQQLTKVYRHLNKRVHAVKRLSVGIPAGECFGLLGVNGAGKTTTFKMLTGEISPTDGSAQVRDLRGQLVDIMDCRKEGVNIGYCPQEDALDNLLTGEEHLYFYARIKGIAKRDIDRVANYLLKKLELDYHRHNTSESYSCGTRRKLSTALALIGQPQILLLDEPSSGMDPRSKRHLWKIISEEVMGKCAVVLTSHSMEECEALCTRLAIMVKGQFRCLGSLQHIKNRFGSGFTVKMYLTDASCDVDAITRFMQQKFPSTVLKDHHSSMLEYHVPVAPGGVADIFDQLESNKAVLRIKHFSVCQTTLDEVFINFAMGKTGTETQKISDPDLINLD